ncbi:MAG: C39 family peptidase [Nocardioidaceae bacterium]|nr:C39 family peptidase [Nocardioidaceae bacterium]
MSGPAAPSRRIAFRWLDLEQPTTGVPAGELIGSVTSAPLELDFAATSVVTSWHAATPGSSWIEVLVRGGEDAWTPWVPIARWADHDDVVEPTSMSGHVDVDGVHVATDEVRICPDRGWRRVQIRVDLMRRGTGADRPVLHRVGVLASRVPGRDTDHHPAPGPVASHDRVLELPVYSQQLHHDRFSEYDGGGGSWCSPTSLAMVLDHVGALPSPEDYTWVTEGPDRFVPHLARRCFDHAYGGAGNWSFNVAYAATRGMTAFVTRLRSFAEAERFIDAGLPLVLSVAFEADQLNGAGYRTDGHLLVLVGFGADGDPVVHDPASHTIRDNAAVRTVYAREQLERAWLGASGGIVYVVHPPQAVLPTAPAEANW